MSLRPLEPEDYPFLDYRRFTFSLAIAAPEGIWLSGSTAVRHDAAANAMVVEGDLVAQSAIIFEKMRLTLVPAGKSLRDLTRLVRYVTPAALGDLDRLDAHQRDLLGSPSVSTIVVNRLLRERALIEMEASILEEADQHSLPTILAAEGDEGKAALDRELAARGLGAEHVVRCAQFVTPGRDPIPAPPGPVVVSPCLCDGSSGVQIETILSSSTKPSIVHVAVDGDPSIGGIAAQCRDAYRRLAESLDAAGSSLDQVVKTTEFVSPAGLSSYRETASTRREVFSIPYPAATGVICEGFPDAGILIAIEATARVDGR